MTGIWKSLDNGDDRLMTIKDTKDKITIEAPNLSCTLDVIQSEATTSPSVVANSVCHALTQTSYARETLTLLRVGQDTFLVTAIVTLRNANEHAVPKVEETYTNKPASVTIYYKTKGN
jgi:hypothetical protein